MNEAKLTELLEHAGERTAVGPPPIDAMRSGATRRRRRRTAVWSAAGTALAVAGVIGASTLLTNNDATPLPQPPVAAKPVPEGMRLVGLANVAIAVPKAWGTNNYKCGMTPERDTVIIDPSPFVAYCLTPRPANVESVWLARKPGIEFHADSSMTIGDVPAQRQTTRCVLSYGKPGLVNECTGAVWIPTLKVWVQAQSSGDALAVDRQLEQISIVGDSLGVPGFQSAEIDGSVAKYTAELQRAGLHWAQKGAGTKVLAVSPKAGTMVGHGSTVTVTVGR